MAFNPASALRAADPVKSMFEKQVSDGSTLAPANDDFYRNVSLELDDLSDDADIYETRGGMAERLSWQLPQLDEDPEECAASGEEGPEAYETRGGLAEKLRTAARGAGVDEYETRGGLAARVQRRLPGLAAAPSLPHMSDGDEYETRGSLAKRLRATPSGSRPDEYEARGGLAARVQRGLQWPDEAPRLPCAQEGEEYEVRGGLAKRRRITAGGRADEYETRGGLAAFVQQGLPGPGAAPCLPCGQEGDEYESRGGLAQQRLRTAPSGARADEYESRGGLAVEVQGRLPGPGAAPALPLACEGGECEVRGGLAEWQLRGTSIGARADEYETRGGLAVGAQGRLPDLSAAPGLACMQEGDEYEVRGGLAERGLRAAVVGVRADEYETCGGLGARTQHWLPVAAAAPGLPRARRSDEYETRGSLASWCSSPQPALAC